MLRGLAEVKYRIIILFYSSNTWVCILFAKDFAQNSLYDWLITTCVIGWQNWPDVIDCQIHRSTVRPNPSQVVLLHHSPKTEIIPWLCWAVVPFCCSVGTSSERVHANKCLWFSAIPCWRHPSSLPALMCCWISTIVEMATCLQIVRRWSYTNSLRWAGLMTLGYQPGLLLTPYRHRRLLEG